MVLGACVYWSRSQPYFLLYNVLLGLGGWAFQLMPIYSNYSSPSFQTTVDNNRVIVAACYHRVAISREVDTVNAICVLSKHFRDS